MPMEPLGPGGALVPVVDATLHHVSERAGWRAGCAREGCGKPPLSGATRCKDHGGRREIAMKLRERDYASLLGSDARLRETFEKFYTDPDICDVRAELALQRTMLAAALAKIGARGKGLEDISVDAMSAISSLNQDVAKLALVVDSIQSRSPNALNPRQVDWVMEQISTSVQDAIEAEIRGRVEVPMLEDEILDREGCDVDGFRSADLARARILRRIADALEDIVLPPSGGRLPDHGRLVR